MTAWYRRVLSSARVPAHAEGMDADINVLIQKLNEELKTRKVTRRDAARQLARFRYSQLKEDLKAVGLDDYGPWVIRDLPRNLLRTPKTEQPAHPGTGHRMSDPSENATKDDLQGAITKLGKIILLETGARFDEVDQKLDVILHRPDKTTPGR